MIAMNYHWSKTDIYNLPQTERKRWVKFIETHLKKKYGEEDL